ncbi:hypothetical protein IX51_00940 [uncultured archaeon]|nr:hypothetical protein IX51_00940 [uncultured archaeon]
MSRHNSKEEERFLLLSKICPQSYSGRTLEENLLFKLCRELKSDYCLGFNDNGYDDKYKGFDSDKVTKEVARLISDQKLNDWLSQNKEMLNDFYDFNGEYYTFNGKNKEFTQSSNWDMFRDRIKEFLEKFGNQGGSVLNAILELNEEGRRYRNYYENQTLAGRKGFKQGVKGQGYNTLLSELELSKIIDFDKRDLRIPEELMPLVQDVLNKRGSLSITGGK